MTEDQKKYIIQARKQGLSYKAISEIQGLPLGSVQTFCRRNSLTSEINEVPQGDNPLFCRNCGKPIVSVPGRKPRQFCSRECGLIWWHAHPEKSNRKAIYSFTCANCGKSFSAYGKAHRKFCSLACAGAFKSKEAKHEAE